MCNNTLVTIRLHLASFQGPILHVTTIVQQLVIIAQSLVLHNCLLLLHNHYSPTAAEAPILSHDTVESATVVAAGALGESLESHSGSPEEKGKRRDSGRRKTSDGDRAKRETERRSANNARERCVCVCPCMFGCVHECVHHLTFTLLTNVAMKFGAPLPKHKTRPFSPSWSD